MNEASNTPRVDSTLSKGLAILENLAASQGSKGVTELSRELELTKSNAFRLLRTLTSLGYVKRLENKTYAATYKAWQVGSSIVENLNLRAAAAPEMTYLSEETGEAIYLAVPEGLSVVYIDKVESQKPIRSWNQVGGSAPIHCVGTGKAILSVNFEQMRDKLDGRLTRHTEKTLTSLDELAKDVADTRKRGYAFDQGEYRDRVFSFGAPILRPDGEAIAALGISLPNINLEEGGEHRLGLFVYHAAESVSQKLRQN